MLAGVSKILRFAALCVLSVCIEAQAAPTGEYEVKAAFIHNIAKFVEWPAAATGAGKLRLCILGDDPFGGNINVLRGKQIGRLVWEVTRINAFADMKSCQVLFISASGHDGIGQIRKHINGSAVLTVGDTRGYAEQGVMVNFYLEENKVRFEINRAAAARAGFRIDSKLLRLGRIVSEQGGGK
ncbi:MAG: YfiR family protein [Nitrosomonadales bacterium]|nr:YfiR family protein [Nitrosomonadales bacterium]